VDWNTRHWNITNGKALFADRIRNFVLLPDNYRRGYNCLKTNSRGYNFEEKQATPLTTASLLSPNSQGLLLFKQLLVY
jgi:hypothetical protein